MGVTVKQKLKGKGNPWWVFINYNGKRKSKKVGDKQAAEEVATKIRIKLKLGELKIGDENKLPSFKEYAEKWLECYVRVMRRESTYDRYKEALRKHIYPVLGEKCLDQITRGEIRNLLTAQIGEGYARETVTLHKNIVGSIFGYALDEEIIASNPCIGITKRLEFTRKRRPEIEPLTSEEVALYLTTCHENYPEFYPLFLCLARTGLRLGEAIAIYLSDIDFNSKYIWIKRTYRRGKFTAPKNDKTRKVDMSDQLTTVLKGLVTERKKEALRSGKGELSDLVFMHNGEIMEQNFVRRIHDRILRKAGLRKIRTHDLRHGYASLLLSKGESPVYVKEQLGHHSIQMTVDIYGHLIPSSNRQAVNKLDDLSAPQAHPESLQYSQSIEKL